MIEGKIRRSKPTGLSAADLDCARGGARGGAEAVRPSARDQRAREGTSRMSPSFRYNHETEAN